MAKQGIKGAASHDAMQVFKRNPHKWFTVDTMTEKIGRPRSTVYTALVKLAMLGVIHEVKSAAFRNDGTNELTYRLITPEPAPQSDATGKGETT